MSPSFGSINDAFESDKTSFKKFSHELKLHFLMGISFFCISIILLILGIVLFTTDHLEESIPFFVVGGPFFIMGLKSLLIWKNAFSQTKAFTNIFNSNDTKKLFLYLDQDKLSNKSNQIAFSLAFLALLELAPKELFDYLSIHLESLRNNPFINYTALTNMISLLASELNLPNSLDMFAQLKTKKVIPLKDSEEQSDDVNLRIPITKVNFIDKLPTNSRSMISGLAIELKERIIVACPFCGNMAEKELLENWLMKSNICPVCKKTLSSNDLPIVKLKS